MALQDKVEDLAKLNTRLSTQVETIDKQLITLGGMSADIAVLKQQHADLKIAHQEMREELKTLASHDKRIALVEHQLAELKEERQRQKPVGPIVPHLAHRRAH